MSDSACPPASLVSAASSPPSSPSRAAALLPRSPAPRPPPRTGPRQPGYPELRQPVRSERAAGLQCSYFLAVRALPLTPFLLGGPCLCLQPRGLLQFFPGSGQLAGAHSGVENQLLFLHSGSVCLQMMSQTFLQCNVFNLRGKIATKASVCKYCERWVSPSLLPSEKGPKPSLRKERLQPKQRDRQAAGSQTHATTHQYKLTI
jgi:hypothetical protein